MAGIAGARRHPAGLPKGFELRGQGRVGGFLHRHLDEAPLAGAFALEQRGDRRGIEMNAGKKIDDGRPRLERRLIRQPGDADQPAHRLDRQIHRQIVAVGTAEPVARAGGVDQPRVDLTQHAPADAEPLHDARRKVLQQHVALLGHAE